MGDRWRRSGDWVLDAVLKVKIVLYYQMARRWKSRRDRRPLDVMDSKLEIVKDWGRAEKAGDEG